MSTRGYYGIKKKGELKGTYNHWDSYPSGLGVDLVKRICQIKKEDRLKVLNDTFDYIELVNGNHIPTEQQKEDCKKANIVDLNVGGRSLDDWYCLLRKTQGDIGFYIDKIIPYMENGNDFLQDTLFCEWAYIINLDTKSFEVYNGNYETSTQNCIAKFDLLELNEDEIREI